MLAKKYKRREEGRGKRGEGKTSASPKNTDERQNAHGRAGRGWERTGGRVDERGTHGRRGGEVRPHGWIGG